MRFRCRSGDQRRRSVKVLVSLSHPVGILTSTCRNLPNLGWSGVSLGRLRTLAHSWNCVGITPTMPRDSCARFNLRSCDHLLTSSGSQPQKVFSEFSFLCLVFLLTFFKLFCLPCLFSTHIPQFLSSSSVSFLLCSHSCLMSSLFTEAYCWRGQI